MRAWDSTATSSAVAGLRTLLRRDEWRNHATGGHIRDVLEPLLDSADETIRSIATMALPDVVEPSRLTDAICLRLSEETDPSVTEVLLGILADQAVIDPSGIDRCLDHLATLPRWSGLRAVPEDPPVPPDPPRPKVSDTLLSVLAYLAFVHVSPFATGLLSAWQIEPQNFPATAGRMAVYCRGYLNPRAPGFEQAQQRAFAFFSTLTNSCVNITGAVLAEAAPGQDLTGTQQQDLASAALIARSIAREMYHASGAFQAKQQGRETEDLIVPPSFSLLAFPVIERLAEVPAAAIAHDLVQTLAFLSRQEPRRAFLAVTKAVTTGSGYEFESLGETAVLDLVDEYLAEKREVILGDPDCLSGLRQIFEAFVAAGSDRAIQRVQDLGELFA